MTRTWSPLAFLTLLIPFNGFLNATEEEVSPKPVFQRAEGGIIHFGSIEIDPSQRTVRFPATTLKVDMPLEYSLVGEGGKTHETLFITQQKPSDIHVAMLLTLPKTRKWEPIVVGNIIGDPVWVDVLWKNSAGEEVRHPLETLIRNEATGSAGSEGPWIYNGSRIVDGVFQAETDKVIFAVFDDPFALINNPRKGHDNDELWNPIWERLPDPGTDVIIEVRRSQGSE